MPQSTRCWIRKFTILTTPVSHQKVTDLKEFERNLFYFQISNHFIACKGKPLRIEWAPMSVEKPSTPPEPPVRGIWDFLCSVCIVNHWFLKFAYGLQMKLLGNMSHTVNDYNWSIWFSYYYISYFHISIWFLIFIFSLMNPIVLEQHYFFYLWLHTE